jgi:hypothetical protein
VRAASLPRRERYVRNVSVPFVGWYDAVAGALQSFVRVILNLQSVYTNISMHSTAGKANASSEAHTHSPSVSSIPVIFILTMKTQASLFSEFRPRSSLLPVRFAGPHEA